MTTLESEAGRGQDPTEDGCAGSALGPQRSAATQRGSVYRAYTFNK
jgi:hypothetical protein